MVDRRVRGVALLLALCCTAQGFAADRRRIATINIGATSLVTLASCVVQKHVHSARDAARCLVAGSVAGAAFYQSKRLAARGDITEGWMVANLASSVVENTAAGEHPLSRLGYTFGPFRLRVATPFDRAHESIVDVDVSAAETMFLTRALLDADDVDIRDGMIWYETRSTHTGQGGIVYDGYTWGIFPGVWSGAQSHTWHHEAIHAVQSLQLDSVDPPALTLDRTRRPIRVRYLRLGALNLVDNIAGSQFSYEDRWAEIEAYRLTEDRDPPR